MNTSELDCSVDQATANHYCQIIQLYCHMVSTAHEWATDIGAHPINGHHL